MPEARAMLPFVVSAVNFPHAAGKMAERWTVTQLMFWLFTVGIQETEYICMRSLMTFTWSTSPKGASPARCESRHSTPSREDSIVGRSSENTGDCEQRENAKTLRTLQRRSMAGVVGRQRKDCRRSEQCNASTEEAEECR